MVVKLLQVVEVDLEGKPPLHIRPQQEHLFRSLPTQRHLVPMLDARYPKGDDPCGVLAKMKSAGSMASQHLFCFI